MYKATDLANYIVEKCHRDRCPVSNLQLQKILYYIQREYLQNNKQAFSDPIEAWQFGPVVPNVYYDFCGFGSMPITISFPNKRSIDYQDQQKINPIIEAKRKLYPWDLVAETHKEGGAWQRTYNNGLGNHCVIPIERIKEER